MNRQAGVEAYKGSVNDIAHDIEARQKALEEIMRVNLGDAPIAAKAGGAAVPRWVNLRSSPQDRRGPRPRRAASRRCATSRSRSRTDFPTRPGSGSPGSNRPFAASASILASSPGLGAAWAAPMSRCAASSPAIRSCAISPLCSAVSTQWKRRSPPFPPAGRPRRRWKPAPTAIAAIPSTARTAFHAGIDFPGTYGQPIIAAASGRVSFVGQRPGYGNVVEIDHGNGIMTRYAHLSRFGARVGEDVKRASRSPAWARPAVRRVRIFISRCGCMGMQSIQDAFWRLVRMFSKSSSSQSSASSIATGARHTPFSILAATSS